MKIKNEINSLRIVGGMIVVGFIIGLVFLHISVQILLASVIIGIGARLVFTPVSPDKKSEY